MQCFLKPEAIALLKENESRQHTRCGLCKTKCKCQNCSMLPLEDIYYHSSVSVNQNDSDISDSDVMFNKKLFLDSLSEGELKARINLFLSIMIWLNNKFSQKLITQQIQII